jgi:hypothetical protein
MEGFICRFPSRAASHSTGACSGIAPCALNGSRQQSARPAPYEPFRRTTLRCHRARATVIAKEEGIPQIRVRDGDGNEWTIGHWQIDCGTLYEVEPGRWRPETDPKVLDALQLLYGGAVRERWAAGCERLHEEFVEDLSATLVRNGRLPV